MLHWLAGKQPPEADPDATGFFEPPDTPAPMFAVRAFKQALFGTPQNTHTKSPRRNSNTEHTRPRTRQPEGRPTRPGLTRPKSAGDAQALFAQHETLPGDVPGSPTKGILLTPGTAAQKRKTVTFGAQVQGNEEKRPTKSGLPDDCPGKFPSPWVRSAPDMATGQEARLKPGGRSKLTEALEQVRDESVKRRGQNDRLELGKPEKEEDIGAEGDADVLTGSVQYWKTQYDIYRENTQREVRKLIMKQKSAKSFARQKDMECMELSEQLQAEKLKTEAQAQRIAELEQRIRRYEQEPRIAPGSTSTATIGNAGVKSEATTSEPRRQSSAQPQNALGIANLTDGLNQRMRSLRPGAMAASLMHDVRLQNSGQNILSDDQGQASPNHDRVRGAYPDQLDSSRPWRKEVNPAFGDGELVGFNVDAPVNLPSCTTSAEIVNRASTAALKSLSVNTLSSTHTEPKHFTPSSPTPATAATTEPRRQRSPVRSAHLLPHRPLPSSQRQAGPQPLRTRGAPERSNAAGNSRIDSVDMPDSIPPSSPFQPDGGTLSPIITEPVDVIPAVAISKENIAPKTLSSVEATTRPSAMWMSVQSQNFGQRMKTPTDRHGQEVSADRLEAARARLQARGRNVS